MRNDVYRQKSVPINRQQAEQVSGLMTLVLGRLYHVGSCDLGSTFWNCIWSSLGGGTHHCLRITTELLLPTGTFCPTDWMRKGQSLAQAENTKTRNIIRAVFQDQVDWICTERPNPARLCELLDAMESWAGWSIMIEPSAPILISHVGERPGRYQVLPIMAFHVNDQIGSKELQKVADEYIAYPTNRVKAARHRLAGEAAVRLNRFLPHLIRLAGGRVKFP